MKPIEQLDRYNQRLKLTVEQRNGQPASLDRYLVRLLSTQSLEAWQGDSEGLRDWAAKCVGQYVGNLDFSIYGYSAETKAA